jgi:hypothetical protein
VRQHSAGAAELATTTTVGPAIAAHWIGALTALALIESQGEIVGLTPSGRGAVIAALNEAADARAATYVRRPRLPTLFARDQVLAKAVAAVPPLSGIG